LNEEIGRVKGSVEDIKYRGEGANQVKKRKIIDDYEEQLSHR